MKNREYELLQPNKSFVKKLLIFIAIIILVEVATGIFAFNQFATRTYRQEFASYKDKSSSVAARITKDYSDEVVSDMESDGTVLSAILGICESSHEFDVNIVFAEAGGGRILYGGSNDEFAIGDNLQSNNINYSETSIVEYKGKTYVFSSARIGDTVYRIGGLSDFTERKNTIDNLLGNVVAVLIASGLLLIIAFLAFAYVSNKEEGISYFKYRLTVDKSGRVEKSNQAFKKEFSSVTHFKTVSELKKKDFNLISLTSVDGDKVLAVRAVKYGPKIKMYGGDVANADSLIQNETSNVELQTVGGAVTSLSNVFNNFIAKGKRTLLGVLYVSKLDQIKTLFGKKMALDIQKIILKKVREKFTYAYEIDFAYIGVTYPDGKKLDNLIADMEDIYRYINSPIKMDDNLFTLEIKAGFAMCDASMQPLNFEHSLQAAEAAKQRVLDTKIADYIIYHESQLKLYAKYFITYNIKEMLADEAFEMEYQPQYNIKKERIDGFEALFRVKKSWNVNVDTFSFITYAERTGAMVQLGDFIFDAGMRFAQSLEGKGVSVSLNVSPVQLMQAGFIENFLNIYRKYELKPGSVCVEITESFLMTNYSETVDKLEVLTQNGIHVHLDDFGTEYSSLLYLKKLPISTIKIDREFVKDVLDSRESQAVIKFITNIAKLLNGTTICEGVETPQEYDMLNYFGCDTIQGWLISKSLSPSAALEILDTFDYKKVVEDYQNKNK